MNCSENVVARDEKGVLAGKYLTFRLSNEEFGIEILMIREILGIMPITGIPRTPPSLKGIVNLRGRVIPVVDLRLCFGMEEQGKTRETCIIVINISSNIFIGIIVDSVSEVLNVQESEIEPPPRFGTNLRTDYILGVGNTRSGMKILLDIERALLFSDLDAGNLITISQERDEQ